MVSNHLRSPNFRSWLMKTSLVNAFAVVRLSKIQEFHLWHLNTNTPNCPYSSLLSVTNQQNRPRVLSYYSILVHSGQKAYLKHPDLFTVNETTQVVRMASVDAANSAKAQGRSTPTTHSTTSFLTAAKLVYAIGAGITAAAGTRLALQWILVGKFTSHSLQ